MDSYNNVAWAAPPATLHRKDMLLTRQQKIHAERDRERPVELRPNGSN
jgi:hypothetical protein